MQEEEMIYKAKNGDMRAFGELIVYYSPTVEKFAWQLGNNPEDIEDITQEVFVRVYRFIDQFSKAKFTTWLYKVTLNVTRDFSRKKAGNLRRLFSLQKTQQQTYEYTESTVLKKEEDRILHQCIQSLDKKYRVPIILFYFHDRKYEEIAEILQLNMSTVKTRLLRGKELLKKQLQLSKRKEGETYGR